MSPLSGKMWPAHPKPLPDELLSSWIVRIARANGLKLQTFCDRVFGKEHQLWNRDIDRSAPAWLVASMACHTGTAIRTTMRTTLGIYRGRLYERKHEAGQLRWILPAGVYHRTRRRFGMQYCPQCLTEDQEPYFRTRWRVAALTFCPSHAVRLWDRCPECTESVIYHRRELGRPSITEPGSLSLCHACGFDLRHAERIRFLPYNQGIGSVLSRVAEHVIGRSPSMGMDDLNVMHQLCKVMISIRTSKLADFATHAVDARQHHVQRIRETFEARPVDDRHHIVQLAAWLVDDLRDRLTAAWSAKAVRYNHLIRDFPHAPRWYRDIVTPLNRHAGSAPSAS